MKFTLSWLKKHLNTTASIDEIAAKLTALGLEVESITDRAAALKSFTVAKILDAQKHPEADKLRVCKVESDVGELQIVCGAPNARAGIYVALAKEGALIPANGMVIKKTKIRGVESCGMLCSADELSLDMDSEGIIELPEAKIGASIVDVLGLDDPVIEIAITPNRADALGVRGVARDLAAAGLGTLTPLDMSAVNSAFKSPVSVSIETSACQQFIGCYVRGVKNGESPAWLKKLLAGIGQKSISALVDITNFITIDLGRPLHVYDAKKLKGNLTVRDSKDSEKLKALDGKEYALPAGLCVIADDARAVAVGGVIGGEETGVDATTTDVFLEVALFNPVAVAKAGRALMINTDARYRFERGVDVAFVETGARYALQMIQKLCGGETSEPEHAGKTPEWKREIAFNAERVKTLGGVDIPATKCIQILNALEFTGTTNITPPSWRADIEGEADLIEEILRVHGYDHIPSTPLPKLPTIGKPALSNIAQRAHLARRVLGSRGFQEACSYSFIPHKQAVAFGGGAEALQLKNPISEELSDMRPSLLPNLLEAAKKNAFRGFKNINICEVGLQFATDKERMVAAGLRTGTHQYFVHGEQFQTCTPPLDAYDVKADALAVLQTLGVNKCDITTDVPAWYHPGRSGAFMQGKNVLGYFGEIHPALAKEFDIETNAVAFEIFLDAIPAARAKSKGKLKLSDFQAVERDFAFVVDSGITAAQIIRSISGANKDLITNVEIFDVYAGKGVEPGKKSVAVKVTLQSFERTLTEADIAGVSQAIIAAAGKHFGGSLRQ